MDFGKAVGEPVEATARSSTTRKLSKLAARFRTDKRGNPGECTDVDRVGWESRIGGLRTDVDDVEVMVGKTVVYTGVNGS